MGSNCTFMELKFLSLCIIKNHRAFKLYLYGIEIREVYPLRECRSRSNCTFMELKFFYISNSPLELMFKLYLYGIEIR